VTSSEHYAVDGIEAGLVRLVADSGGSYLLPLPWLPADVRVGDVLEVLAISAGAGLIQLRRDAAEQQRRLERRREVLERLKGSDPGGDLTL
jgi:hypothetical protein